MKVSEAKNLKWGDYIVPTSLHREKFRQGTQVRRGIFLGISKDNPYYGQRRTLIRVVHENTSTVYRYDPAYWEKENYENDTSS